MKAPCKECPWSEKTILNKDICKKWQSSYVFQIHHPCHMITDDKIPKNENEICVGHKIHLEMINEFKSI